MGLPVTAQGVPRFPRWGVMLGAFTPLGTEKVWFYFFTRREGFVSLKKHPQALLLPGLPGAQ